ncbi:MAG: DUF3047 domain-containing protein [Desulfocapsa sp.]|jgi:hypothetical protein|nr:DUF3047 domain-containing protein [Desulfocapsa sp.]
MNRLLISIYVLVIFSFPGTGCADDQIVVGDFSAKLQDGILPDRWKPLLFNDIERHTVYTHILDENIYAIQARSIGSSSGLIRKITIDPAIYPTVSFRWKIQNIIESADLTDKDRNDAPARVFITFAYDSDKVSWFEKVKFETSKLFYGKYPPATTLCYVWASHLEQGTITRSPYSDRVRIIVLESGADKTGTWVSEKRNVFADYRTAFATESVPMISGVAVMTDTDNTDGQAVAWYGDIVFSDPRSK